ncbi:SDR family NAD(P)-dependent oxidoreductase [Brevibacillus sp. B_LB10_24]|uniref:SDR family NAD(P)-dependent oxidoreductase n=1 Tax=Brevibacillus sp. B_LB10_24 TaxID=3380645 RepID=UPI0038B8499B
MCRLQNKVAIVTGGASGIGRSIVKRFVDEGAKVIAIDIQEELLKNTAKEINQKVSGSCIPKTCDVTIGSQVTEVMDAAWEEFGNIEILVNNAGGGGITCWKSQRKCGTRSSI